MDRIVIEGLEVDCIVGVRPLERRRKQLVRLDLSLFLDLALAGRTGRISETVDYARMADEVCALLRFREYLLIEVATEELVAMLFGVHPALQALQIRLEKPEALRGRARSASVQVHRERAQCQPTVSAHQAGERAVLLTTHAARLELFKIPAGATLELAASPRRCLVWKVAGHLHRDGRPLDREPLEGPAQSSGAYVNSGNEEAVLFRCECEEAV